MSAASLPSLVTAPATLPTVLIYIVFFTFSTVPVTAFFPFSATLSIASPTPDIALSIALSIRVLSSSCHYKYSPLSYLI